MLTGELFAAQTLFGFLQHPIDKGPSTWPFPLKAATKQTAAESKGESTVQLLLYVAQRCLTWCTPKYRLLQLLRSLHFHLSHLATAKDFWPGKCFFSFPNPSTMQNRRSLRSKGFVNCYTRNSIGTRDNETPEPMFMRLGFRNRGGSPALASWVHCLRGITQAQSSIIHTRSGPQAFCSLVFPKH